MNRNCVAVYGSHFGDWVDRLNYVFTPSLFIFTAIVSAMYQFFGNPINCWTPVQFTEQMIDFTESHCWDTNYWYSLPENSSYFEKIEAHNMPNMYKWMPAFFLISGLLFCLPMFGLKMLVRSFGLNVTLLKNTMDNEASNLSSEIFSKTAKCAAHQIGLYLDTKTKQRSFPCPIKCRVVMAIMYIGHKLDYIFVSLSVFIGLVFVSSFELMTSPLHFINNLTLQRLQTLLFPDKLILCDMTVRSIANNQRYTVECAVTIVNFYEKVFIIFWVWLTLLTLLNFFNFWAWIMRSACCSRSVSFISRVLEAAEENRMSKNGRPQAADHNRQRVASFSRNYLKCDGRLLLVLLLDSCNPLLVYQVVAELFRMFNEPSENLLLQTTAFAAEIGLATSQKKSSAENASGGVSATAETYPRRPLASASRPSFAQQEPAFDMAGHPPSYRYD